MTKSLFLSRRKRKPSVVVVVAAAVVVVVVCRKFIGTHRMRMERNTYQPTYLGTYCVLGIRYLYDKLSAFYFAVKTISGCSCDNLGDFVVGSIASPIIHSSNISLIHFSVLQHPSDCKVDRSTGTSYRFYSYQNDTA